MMTECPIINTLTEGLLSLEHQIIAVHIPMPTFIIQSVFIAVRPLSRCNQERNQAS
jgi:hypothetical protein